MRKLIKKIIPYCFILLILAGLFGAGEDVMAQTPSFTTLNPEQKARFDGLYATCMENRGYDASGPSICESQAMRVILGTGSQNDIGATTTATTTDESAFDRAVTSKICVLSDWTGGSIEGCILQFVYWTFYTLGGWLLAIAASLFNFLIMITLGSALLKSNFVSSAWAVVRDLSNLFFILVLLYIAIKMILGLGGSDVKKMIVQVIIMALLINFSMFMTHIVIDTSNVLALVFYNKVNTTPKKDNKAPNAVASLIDYATETKDIAGGLTQSFNPVYKLPSEFFTSAVIIKIPGRPPFKEPISTGILIGITVIAGAIMLFAAYALFISALSFLGRLIELFILIIFSPFAFMSLTVPKFAGLDYLGWDAWLKRLLNVSFMAPIFMFFLYFIFLLLADGASMFSDSLKGEGVVHTLLGIMLPAIVIMTLLLKATEFAKKGGGKFGELAIGAGKLVGGLALGAGIGGAAMAARTTIGGGLGGLANKVGAKRLGGYLQSKSYDVRTIPGAGKLLGATGLAGGAGAIKTKEGGWTQMKKEQVEKRMKRADETINRKTSGKKKKVEDAQAELDEKTLLVKVDLDEANKAIEKWKGELADAQRAGDARGVTKAQMALAQAKDDKTNLRARAGLGVAENKVRDAQRDLDTEIGKVASAQANRVKSSWSKAWGLFSNLGAYSVAGADEAARNIRRRAKLETKT